jgi:LEA14-like dessication related protein
MEERVKILEMLAEGTITVEEAKELLDTLDQQKVALEKTDNPREVSMVDVAKGQAGKVLHIKVNSQDGDKIDINLPLAFLKAAIKIGNGKEMLLKSINGRLQGIDPDIIISSIEHGITGKIIDVKSSDGDKVEIYID